MGSAIYRYGFCEISLWFREISIGVLRNYVRGSAKYRYGFREISLEFREISLGVPRNIVRVSAKKYQIKKLKYR
jgi:hypothetical protein